MQRFRVPAFGSAAWNVGRPLGSEDNRRTDLIIDDGDDGFLARFGPLIPAIQCPLRPMTRQ